MALAQSLLQIVITAKANQASQVAQKLKTDYKALASEVTRAGADLRQTSGRIDDWIGKLKAATPENARFAASASKITTAFEEGKISADQARAGLEGVRAEMKRAEAAAMPLKEKVVGAFQAIGKAIASLTAGVAIIGLVVTQAMALGKAGAQMDYARSKFDRLSESVNVAGDVMLGKLRAATHGMRSDAELVALAGDVMSLGLVKTSDQVIRLTRVVGSLNMDMNQLVLTLANKTTMRFDQLGISVDGFDEKVKELEATGMSADAAFTEAFLRQAEEQVNKVGDAADSTVSDFARLEAATKNLGDAMKQWLAKPLADAASAAYDLLTMSERLNQITQEHNENVAKSDKTYAEYRAEMERAAAASGLVIQQTKDGIKTYENHLFVMKDVTDQMRVMTEAEWAEYRAAEAAAALRASFTDDDRLAAWAQRSAQGMEGLNTAVGNSLDAWSKYRDAIEGIKQTQLDINIATIQLQEAQKEYGKSVGTDVAGELKNAGLTGDAYREALGLIDQAMGTGLGVQQDYNDRVRELAEQYQQGKIKGDEFKEGLKAIAEEFAPFDEKIQQIKQRVWELNRQLDLLNREVKVKVTYTEEGPVPGGSKNTTGVSGPSSDQKSTGSPGGEVEKRAIGGYLNPGGSYIVGERGIERIDMGGRSGFVTPIENNSMTNHFTIIQQPGQSAQALADAIANRIGRMSRQAQVAGMGSAGR